MRQAGKATPLACYQEYQDGNRRVIVASITRSIEVDVPVRSVYNQWTQFETFPQFMEGVKEVRQIDDTHLLWHADIGGKDQEWEAVVSEQTPDQHVAWHSVAGAEHAGVVTFHYIEPEKTRVTLQMDYDPEGMVENVGNALGFVTRQVESDLERFKGFIESRGSETGGWRGEVRRE
jgi:uncharacterized membrane protein